MASSTLIIFILICIIAIYYCFVYVALSLQLRSFQKRFVLLVGMFVNIIVTTVCSSFAWARFEEMLILCNLVAVFFPSVRDVVHTLCLYQAISFFVYYRVVGKEE